MTEAERQRRAMIERIKTGYANGWPVLKLSQMSGLSTEEVARIVQRERGGEAGT